MTKYEKPVLEIIELRPEERLARGSVGTNGLDDEWTFTVKDKIANDEIIDRFFAMRDNGDVFSWGGKTKTWLNDFLVGLGLSRFFK